jgi:hypothetical protein
LRRQLVDQRIILTVRHVILVLNADDWRQFLRIAHLSGGDVTQPDMANQPAFFQLQKGG